jgi:hypothetical protein
VSSTVVCIEVPSALSTVICVKEPLPSSTAVYAKALSASLTIVCIVNRCLHQGTVYAAGAGGGGGKVCFVLCIRGGAG